MLFRSLRFKLTMWYVLILAVLLITFSSFLYVTLSRILYRSLDNRLQALAGLIASESASPLSRFGFGSIDRALESSLNLRPVGKFIQVLDESGRIGQKSENLRNVQLPISLNALRNASKGIVTYETVKSFGNTPLRIVTMPVLEEGRIVRIIQVASSLEDVEEALSKLLIILIITVPSALVVASLGGEFLANKALRPVDEITRTARRITSENLNQRIGLPRVKDEIGRLIETFNEMISRLETSFRQIKQFTADASHELKTPLTILKGEVEVALRKDRPPEEYRQILQSNLEEINRMASIIDDLLLLARTDTGEIQLHREDISLPEIVSQVVEQVDVLARRKNIRVVSPAIKKEVRLFADPLRIRQLLLNLIENGIKYTPEGGWVSVDVEKLDAHSLSRDAAEEDSMADDGFIRLKVSDNGVGISKDDQKRIFDRFFRVDKSRSRDEGGSGLGLSICKWIVEAHNGRILVDSELGRGSTFIVELPISSR